MVDISIVSGKLHLEVQGWDKLWAFKSQIEIPLEHVRGVRILSDLKELKSLAREMGISLKAPGTAVPGLVVAGTYYFLRGGKVFIDVHRPFKDMLLIELADEAYSKLVVEVENPEATVRLIQNALAA